MDTGLIIIYTIVGLFALIGFACFVLLCFYITECIKDSIEAENYKSPYLYEDNNEEV